MDGIELDQHSSLPPFEQVRTGIIALVQEGRLTVGTRLPTVRALAASLGVAANTVARAYRELESDGIIQTRGRNGSFVLASGDVIHRKAQEAARSYVYRAEQLGLDRAEALAIVTAALNP